MPEFGAAVALFPVPRLSSFNFAFEVTKDGQGFVAMVTHGLDPSPLTMVIRAAVR